MSEPTYIDQTDASDATSYATVFIKKKPTNADRIRSMTDEELAHELATRFSTDCNCCPAVNGCPVWSAAVDAECEDSFLKWLKQEAEE